MERSQMLYSKQDGIKDFIKRTKENLDIYIKQNQKDPAKYPWEVTATINSFLGLIVLPQEQKANLLENIEIPTITEKIKIAEKTNKELFRHLRNSIAHGHFFNNILGEENIETIIFTDYNPHNKKQTFEISLSIQEIQNIISAIYNQTRNS